MKHNGCDYVGTFAWAAPEALTTKSRKIKMDMFSFDVVLWEIVTCQQPCRGRLRDIR